MMYLKVQCDKLSDCINNGTFTCTHCSNNAYKFDTFDRFCANPCDDCDLELARTDCSDFDYEECVKWWKDNNSYKRNSKNPIQSEATIEKLIDILKQKNKNIINGKHTIIDPYEKDVVVKTNKIWIQCLKWVLDGESVGKMYTEGDD